MGTQRLYGEIELFAWNGGVNEICCCSGGDIADGGETRKEEVVSRLAIVDCGKAVGDHCVDEVLQGLRVLEGAEDADGRKDSGEDVWIAGLGVG